MVPAIGMAILVATGFAQMCLFWVPMNCLFTGWCPAAKALGGLQWLWGIFMFVLVYELLHQLQALPLGDGGLWPKNFAPQLKDWCGLPWGVAITPLGAESVEHEASDIRAQDVARCDACGGYINPYCQVDIAQRLWQCALCRAHNRLGARYASGRRELLPELTHDAMTYTLAPARAPAGASV